ncbi:MAG: cyclodeaminase/cyclohydrolase family protein [Firmicutes bacterium]|nr:cyclodeaminase/cyclohydrolase family protein [Dethiobacter sp.]MBS3887743.1 cyclodeaminase/cyclohydrolase family protein [Bacillota bacterium]MBS4053910.1 cyclodeaminase/cyclohydrolase family protein [Thermaerobacter sp.]
MHFAAEKYNGILDALASGDPTPGGGTAAALAGAMAASLVEMVASLTVNRKKYVAVQAEMEAAKEAAHDQRSSLLALADEDALAYQAVMAAHKLPKLAADEVAARQLAIEKAVRLAAEVPLRTASAAFRVLEQANIVAEKGNHNALTDAGVAGLMAFAALRGALYNVRINLTSLDPQPAWAEEMAAEAAALLARATVLEAQVSAKLAALR